MAQPYLPPFPLVPYSSRSSQKWKYTLKHLQQPLYKTGQWSSSVPRMECISDRDEPWLRLQRAYWRCLAGRCLGRREMSTMSYSSKTSTQGLLAAQSRGFPDTDTGSSLRCRKALWFV
ncbi:hypothetical protein LIA77_09673 [Sarocladium implicatum]|nr:hypothetical protein LIA77_09673 [Sarocladium implicatum]